MTRQIHSLLLFRLSIVLILSLFITCLSATGQNKFLNKTSIALTFEPNAVMYYTARGDHFKVTKWGYGITSYLFFPPKGQFVDSDQLHTNFSAGLRFGNRCISGISLNSGILFHHEYYLVGYDNAEAHQAMSYDLYEYFSSYIRIPVGISKSFNPGKKVIRTLGIAFNFDFLMKDKVQYIYAPSNGLHTKSYPLIMDRIIPELAYSRTSKLYKNLYLKLELGYCFAPVFQKAHHEFIIINNALSWRLMLEYQPKKNHETDK